MLSTGCQAGTRVVFHGLPAPAVSTEQVRQVEALPRDVRQIGRVMAGCRTSSLTQGFQGSLLNADCSVQRLEHALKELAAARGGDWLAGLTCDGRRQLQCRALVGRSAQLGNAAVSSSGTASDARGRLGEQIQLRLLAATAVPDAPRGFRLSSARRAASEVREYPQLPPSHAVVASVEARCADCSVLALRDGLKLAAARLAGADLVGVHCSAAAPQCVGDIALSQESLQTRPVRRAPSRKLKLASRN